mgnify:CR=1 FL=1
MKRFYTLLLIAAISFSNFVHGEAIARVMKSNGDVMLKALGKTTFSTVVKPGLGINNGDAIRIGETGFAVIIYIDDRSVVKIRENTEFEFIDSPSTRTIEIKQGTIFNNVSPQHDKTFIVATPVSVASVKGTEFAVVSDPAGIDQFFCQEGTFDVYNTVSEQTINVQSGQQAISSALGTLTQQPFNPDDYPEEPDADIEDIEEEVEEEEPEETEPEGEEEEPEPEETEPEGEEEEPEPEETEPEEQPESIEEAPESTPEAEKPFNMGLGVGSVTIDGMLYNQLALRPEFNIGKLGIGLDLVVYIDNEGNVRPNEWDMKNDPSVIMDKILYLRWGQKEDPFWIKLGSLDNVTLGYGGLLMGYSNMMEFPTVRQMGINTGMQFGNFGTELFMSNIKDFSRGGTLLGLRGSYKVSKTFPLTIGANFVMDINQFSGLKDKDEDSYPDIFDDFPDDKTLWNDTDGDGIPDPHAGVDSTTWDIDANGNNIYDADETDLGLKGSPFSIENNTASVMGYSFDIGYPVFSNKMVSLDVYAEFNFLNFPKAVSQDSTSNFYRPARTGSGFSVPGVRMSLFKFLNVSFEYRIKSGYYVPQFFDQSYDITRVTPIYIDDQTDILTKDMMLFANSTMNEDLNGYFGSISADLFGFASISGSYANMTSDSNEVKSFVAALNLNPEKIPKLSVATAYYQRNNDSDPFDFDNPSLNTVLGYRLGYEVSKGVSVIWDYRQFYRDDGTGELEPIKQTTIETAFDF